MLLCIEFCLIQQTLASAPIIVQSTFSKDYNEMVAGKSYCSLVELVELAELIPHRDRICCSNASVQYSLLSRINCRTAAV